MYKVIMKLQKLLSQFNLRFYIEMNGKLGVCIKAYGNSLIIFKLLSAVKFSIFSPLMAVIVLFVQILFI